MNKSTKATTKQAKPKAKHAGGRPTKLTPTMQAEICEYISQDDLYAVDACALCGISRTTYYAWKEWGEAGVKPFAEFLDTIEKAEARAKLTLMRTMKADPRYFAMYMTILERRFPAQYSRQDRTQHEHGGELKVNINWSETNGSSDGAKAH